MFDRQQFQIALRDIAAALARIEVVREHAAPLSAIAERALVPFTLAVAGIMKAGKSTLINALVGQPVAPIGTEEATATINLFRQGTAAEIGFFIVHYKDSRIETRPLADLALWTGKTPEVVARVRDTLRLEFPVNSPLLEDCQIVDTPGTGSAEDSHEETAREFLDSSVYQTTASENEKADAILYVVGGTGRASDLDTLATFKRGVLPGSNVENSLCVFHKWDALTDADPAAEATRKAAALQHHLSHHVAATLAVSGPLALAASAAPDTLFEQLAALLATLDAAALEDALETAAFWDEDPARAATHALAAPFLPWVSFRLLVRHLHAKAQTAPLAADSARAAALALSGMEALREIVREKFFLRAEILKAYKLLVTARAQLDPAVSKLNRLIEKLRRHSAAAALAAEHARLTNARAQIQTWLTETLADLDSEATRVTAAGVAADRRNRSCKGEIERLNRDLESLRRLEPPGALGLAADELRLARFACNPKSSEVESARLWTNISLPRLQGWIDRFRHRSNTSSRTDAETFSHITERLEEIYAIQHERLNSSDDELPPPLPAR